MLDRRGRRRPAVAPTWARARRLFGDVVTPESVHAGPISRVRDGDVIRLDTVAGTLDVLADPGEFAARSPALRAAPAEYGTGRELFHALRSAVGRADEGAHVFATLGRTAELGDLALTQPFESGPPPHETHPQPQEQTP